jgi:hypothetical protein
MRVGPRGAEPIRQVGAPSKRRSKVGKEASFLPHGLARSILMPWRQSDPVV